MNIIGQRVIEYLKADTVLVNLLGDARNIYALGLNEIDNRPSKYVCVECSPGEDLNNIPAQKDDFDVEIGVSRKIENSFAVIMVVVSRVDDLLNKGETGLTSGSWKVIHMTRVGSPTKGPLIDDKNNEYYFSLKYEYILDESS